MALASVLSWLECHPIDHQVTGSIPAQGTYPTCGFDPETVIILLLLLLLLFDKVEKVIDANNKINIPPP